MDEVDEDEELLEGEPVATVKMCPAKDVVVPEVVASVIAGPPTEVTSTTGAPLTAYHPVSQYNLLSAVDLYVLVIVANAWEVSVPRMEVASFSNEDASNILAS